MIIRQSEGFVLPYVLCVIFVLSFAGLIAVERLKNATQTILLFEERAKADLALFTAESDAVFSVITGVTIQGGVALNPQTSPIDPLGVDKDDEGIEPNLWRANGEWRRSRTMQGDVYVNLQDAAGLVSLNTTAGDELVKLLKFLGLTSDQAKMFSARILDYSDQNLTRRFRGAERADYTLRKRTPPSNSPIRNHEELTAILGWNEIDDVLDLEKLKAYTTLRLTGGLRDKYAKPPLLEVMSEANVLANSGGFDIIELEKKSVLPSDYSRLTMIYPYSSGGYREKAVEIRRQVNNIDAPFKLFWVYEKNLSIEKSSFKIETSNVKNVIHTASSSSG